MCITGVKFITIQVVVTKENFFFFALSDSVFPPLSALFFQSKFLILCDTESRYRGESVGTRG